MIIPIRCVTCGKPVAHLWEKYQQDVAGGKKPKAVLDELGLERYCCRTLFLTHVDIIDDVARFKK
ncbi:MAG: DNA-directed RNA polymerase subunit N [Candidatus Aenigmarchaeota archaeon]|nr:DNA-directed RNA polymerase subunit N [Candidatus Aenigmarchaeota archaeon]